MDTKTDLKIIGDMLFRAKIGNDTMVSGHRHEASGVDRFLRGPGAFVVDGVVISVVGNDGLAAVFTFDLEGKLIGIKASPSSLAPNNL